MAHTNIDEQTRFKATELASKSDDFNKIGFETNSTKSVIQYRRGEEHKRYTKGQIEIFN